MRTRGKNGGNNSERKAQNSRSAPQRKNLFRELEKMEAGKLSSSLALQESSLLAPNTKDTAGFGSS